MIQLKVEKLNSAIKKATCVAMGLTFTFLVAPPIAMEFARFLPSKQLSIGYVVSNVVPASSASIGYVLIAEGDIELATVLAVLSLIGAFLAIPGYLKVYASAVAVNLPLGKIVQSLTYTLLIPFAIGQLTRYLLIKRRAAISVINATAKVPEHPCLKGLEEAVIERKFSDLKACVEGRLENSIKPHLSLTTMLSMLTLIALLIANKAAKLVGHPYIALKVLGLQLLMLALLLGLITLIDKVLGVSYEDHMSIALISATKNQSVAAAIAVMALGSEAAIVPALVPVVQAPVAIAYLQAAPTLRALLKG